MSAPPESPSVQHPSEPRRRLAPGHSYAGVPAARRTSTTAVLGLLLALVLPPLGLVLSAVAVRGTGAYRARGRGLAVAGVVLSGIGTSVWAVVLVAALAGGGTALDPVDEPVAAPPVTEPGPVQDAVTGGAATDPAAPAFEAPTTDTWAELVRDPASHEGEEVSVHAEVFRLDRDAGTLLVNAGPSQPSGGLELADPALVSAPAHGLDGLAAGDVVRVDAVVDGTRSYTTVDGADGTVLALRAVVVEPVGYLDLSRYVTTGPPTPERFGGVDVPVTVVNRGDVTYNYDVTVTATSPDGATTYATTSAYVDDLVADGTGEGVASFLEPVPADAVYGVTAVHRYAASADA